MDMRYTSGGKGQSSDIGCVAVTVCLDLLEHAPEKVVDLIDCLCLRERMIIFQSFGRDNEMDSKPIFQVAPFDQGAYLIVDLLELDGNSRQRMSLE